MTVFIHDNCKWLATGEVVCQNGKKQAHVLEGFADMAALGEKCNNATCSKGTCFKDKNSTDSYCKNVMFANQVGCSTTEHSTCVQGLDCIDNTCINPLTKASDTAALSTATPQPTTQTAQVSQVTQVTKTTQPSKLVQAPSTAPATSPVTKEEKVATKATTWVSKLQSINYRKAVMYTLVCLVIYVLFMIAFYIGRVSAPQTPTAYSSYSY